MILYYAMGGGLGHLTRARALVHTLGLRGRVSVLTASPFAADRRVTGDFEVVNVPRDLQNDLPLYRSWLRDTLHHLSPSRIYVDSFPGGILGELCGFDFPGRPRLHYVARLLRWPEYGKQLRGNLPRFDNTYVIEPLTEEHRKAVEKCSAEILPLKLEDPPDTSNDEIALRRRERDGRRLWLVVHGGQDSETVELLEYARELRTAESADARICLISPGALAGLADVAPTVERIDVYPASTLFPFADRIISGCGFNMMRQTEQYAERHCFIPFPRRFDDQFLRASRRRKLEHGVFS